MTDDYLQQVFGAGGWLAAALPRYKPRPGQLALSRAIHTAMDTGRHILGEGPCGTGKGLAYGVPAVYHARHNEKRVVIATANIALQEQLVTHDLPLLRRVLPWPFEWALLKGRNNYLCLDKLQSDGHRQLPLLSEAGQAQWRRLEAWCSKTDTGDVAELPFVPASALWSQLSVGADECKGEACKQRDDCFSERRRRAAAEADIVVTNYHLLFAHLALKQQTGEDLVLPPFDLLVLDEAHQAADIARDFWGFSITQRAIERMAVAGRRAGFRSTVDAVERHGRTFFSEASRYMQARAAGQTEAKPSAKHLLSSLTFAAVMLNDALKSADGEEHTRLRYAAKQANELRSNLHEHGTRADKRKVYWVEVDAKTGAVSLQAKPIDVSTILGSGLFGAAASVTAVSATMTTGGSFDFIRRQLGVPADAMELSVDSPFDFERQALLVLPAKLPEPRSGDFPDAVADTLREVIDRSDGRTLALFTSYRVMNLVATELRRAGYTTLVQGQAPRTELVERFRQQAASALLGTESFWTGVDVPGEALTAVVIDKLPFPRPDDPVVAAISERDPKAFHRYLLPKAIITLRQGVGRLIRSETDRGVVVLTDCRIAEKGYGKRVLRSLPPMLRTRRLENITRFLSEPPP